MLRVLMALGLLATTGLAAGCVEDSRRKRSKATQETQATAPVKAHVNQPIEAKVELKVEVDRYHNATLRVWTNLPVDGLMRLSVVGPFSGEEEATIGKDGRIEVGPFGRQEGLPKGRYHAWATLLLPEDQPPEVRQDLGDKGKWLRGPLVVEEQGRKTVAVSVPFTVGRPPDTDEVIGAGTFPSVYRPRTSSDLVQVHGYYRKNGTYVAAHVRSAPGSGPSPSHQHQGGAGHRSAGGRRR
jgi:hypothetical protein